MRRGAWREHPEARTELRDQADYLPLEVAERLLQSAEDAVADVLGAPGACPTVSHWAGPPTLPRRKIKPR